MSRISVRGFAVASATAVTTVGAVVGVASGDPQSSNDNFEATAADTTLLADIPAGEQAQVQVASLSQQAEAQASAADTAARKSAEEAARIQAAKDAKAKKEAADDKAEKERKEKEERANRSSERSDISNLSASSFNGDVKALARQMVGGDQFQCFSNIVDHESGWNYQATNPSSGAYGLVQALPGSKMASAGADWRTNPATQIKWGLNYMNERYGSPCGAWSFWQANSWY
ncbi:transglycosylase SLT domain-containing protein [Streptomyces sp. NPDC001941]|uniref:aggregation-promoting factor C-terminal-like domain-containing protein n=1 Tax=Streptomyces sp. NPDC001941 TaxID=3154659 RepID=UPI00332CA746